MSGPTAGWRCKKHPLASRSRHAIYKSVADAPSSFFRPAALLRYAVSLGVLGWIAWKVEWTQFAGLHGIDWNSAWVAILLAGAAYPLQAWRWHRLLKSQGVSVPAGRIHAIFWVGHFYNSFLPGGIAGDGVRLFYVWRQQPGKRAAAAAAGVADRAVGFGALLALAALALAVHLVINGGGTELQWLLAVSAGSLGFIFAAAWFFVRSDSWFSGAGKFSWGQRVIALRSAVNAILTFRAELAVASVISVTVWLIDFVSLWLLARAVGLIVGPLEMCVAAAAAYVVASLPISVGGHGVREGTLVAVLGWLGIGSGQAAAVPLLALAFWAVSTGWSIAGALAFLVTPWSAARPAKIESASFDGTG